jgi:hypothetical protein
LDLNNDGGCRRRNKKRVEAEPDEVDEVDRALTGQAEADKRSGYVATVAPAGYSQADRNRNAAAFHMTKTAARALDITTDSDVPCRRKTPFTPEMIKFFLEILDKHAGNRSRAQYEITRQKCFATFSRANFNNFLKAQQHPARDRPGRKVHTDFEMEAFKRLCVQVVVKVNNEHDDEKDVRVTLGNITFSKDLARRALKDEQARLGDGEPAKKLKFSDEYVADFLKRHNLRRRRVTAAHHDRPSVEDVEK